MLLRWACSPDKAPKTGQRQPSAKPSNGSGRYVEPIFRTGWPVRMTPHTDSPLGTLRLALTVVFPFALGYFVSYIYRTVSAVLAPYLIADVGLSASDLGLLTSAYFLAFAIFQLPVGMLLDRYGPRRVQATVLLVAAAGAALFSVGDGLLSLSLARALIGIGVASGLMAAFKAVTLWFPQRLWPVMNGIVLAAGGVGAMTSTKPVELALGFTDWRTIFLGLALFTLAFAAFLILVVPEKPQAAKPTSLADQARGFRLIFSDRLFWTVAPLTAIVSGTGLGLAGLWAGPWLGDVGGHDRGTVATYLFAVTAMLTVGSLSTGFIANIVGRRGISLVQVMGAGFVIYLGGQLAIVFAVDPTALWPWLIFGYFIHICLLSYPYLAAHFPREYAGRSNTALNVLAFFTAFGVQYFVGAVLDRFPPKAGGGYAVEGYTTAFGILAALQVAAFVWFLYGLATRPKRLSPR